MQLNKICLIGFMCSGKTSVGKELSKKLNYNFIDLDDEIIKNSYSSIEDLFKIGESYFRDFESKILGEVINNDNIVLSLGGGTLLKKENKDLIFKNDYHVIFLKTALCNIKKRFLSQNKKRPLFNINNIENLYNERCSIYNDFHLKIETDNLNVDEVVKVILERIN